MRSPWVPAAAWQNPVLYMPDGHPGTEGGPGASLYQVASSAPTSDPGAGSSGGDQGAEGAEAR